MTNDEEDVDPLLRQKSSLKIKDLHDEKVKPDFKRMKKGHRLLFDFIEQKIEDEISDNRY